MDSGEKLETVSNAGTTFDGRRSLGNDCTVVDEFSAFDFRCCSFSYETY